MVLFGVHIVYIPSSKILEALYFTDSGITPQATSKIGPMCLLSKRFLCTHVPETSFSRSVFSMMRSVASKGILIRHIAVVVYSVLRVKGLQRIFDDNEVFQTSAWLFCLLNQADTFFEKLYKFISIISCTSHSFCHFVSQKIPKINQKIGKIS